MFTQTIIPNPNIACKPGWCLQYVRETFGQPAVAGYGSATAAWENSKTRHKDRDFPTGVWLPVYYGLANEPLGHIVLRAPDGSVYSTSDLSNTPHHHADLADLEAYYAYYGMALHYRGWTEDVEGTPVLAPAAITAQSTTTKKEGFLMALTDEQQQLVYDRLKRYVDSPISATAEKVWEAPFVHQGTHSARTEIVRMHQKVIGLTNAITALSKNPGLSAEQITVAVQSGFVESAEQVLAAIPDDIAEQVVTALAARLGKQVS